MATKEIVSRKKNSHLSRFNLAIFMALTTLNSLQPKIIQATGERLEAKKEKSLRLNERKKFNFLSHLISQQFFNSFHSFYRTNYLKLKVCNVLASDESRQFTQLVHSNFSQGKEVPY